MLRQHQLVIILANLVKLDAVNVVTLLTQNVKAAAAHTL